MDCPHRPPCPGCPRFGEAGIRPAVLDALVALARSEGLAPPRVVEAGAPGHRHRARLAVRGRATSPKIGIFQEDSHRITDIPRCVVHHPLVNAVAAAVKTAVRRTGVPLYGDRSHRGLLRYLQVVVERSSDAAQVVLVANDESHRALDATADVVRAELGRRLHSLWWNGNTTSTNAILGPRWHRWTGPETTCETIGGARIFYPPGAFGQANLPLADRLVSLVHEWVPAGTRVLEMHAGVGAIGLGLAARGHEVVFNEVSRWSLAGLNLGLDALGPDVRRRTRVLRGPAADHVAAIDDADVVVCDPPRRGLEAPLLARLAADPPSRLVLVSCNPDTFLVEARRLLDGGKARLTAIVPFALFPYTDHVETVARFERVRTARAG
jgi:tRNA/tmRNA/rRNA uracil-C5-methylase (TrmA/RlmC/RlmD family)